MPEPEHAGEPGCRCGRSHCVVCGEVWPCTTRQRERPDPHVLAARLARLVVLAVEDEPLW